MNKKIKVTGLVICLMCCTGMTHAQEAPATQERQQQEKRLPREVPNPEKIATQLTKQMKESLQLTDKQYKKIYKLNLKEQKEHFKSMQNSSEQRPPMGRTGIQRGRPPMGGGGEPPMMGEGGFPGRMGGGPMMNRESNSADSQKKAAEAKEKKIKKILTTEQYEKWQAEQTAARKKASQRRTPKGGRSSVGPIFDGKELQI